MFTIVPGAADADDPCRDGSSSLIGEIVRDGARRMLTEALQAEVDAYIARFSAERDDNGHRLVVRNGSRRPREGLTSAGAVEVVAPRVNDRRIDPDTGERARFSSAILPPWCRKTPKITRSPDGQKAAVVSWVDSALASAEEEGHAVFVAVTAGSSDKWSQAVLGFVSVAERRHFTGEREGYIGELVVAPWCRK